MLLFELLYFFAYHSYQDMIQLIPSFTYTSKNVNLTCWASR